MREIIFRAKRVDNGEWVEGSFLPDLREVFYRQKLVDGFIKPFGKTKEEREIVQVDRETVCQYAGMDDADGNMIFEGDILEIFGMRGKVVQECGAFGVYFPDGIDYDLLKSKIPYNNSACFCYTDNFISIWEFWWNYEQDDNPLYCAKIIGNDFDNPEWLD